MAKSALGLRAAAGCNTGLDIHTRPAMTKTSHLGACHCGKVQFELQAALAVVFDCNCSICRRRGALWHGAADADLRITKGEAELTLYQFNTKTAKHYFCPSCGITPFVRPRYDPSSWAVNVRCIAGADLQALTVLPFDGEHWETAAAALFKSRAAEPAN
jgi:hypothetical protein